MDQLILADLITDLPDAVRLQRAVHTLREYFECDAVGLLTLDDDSLRLVAASGLAHEALGRRFVVAQHPRFATILSRREPTWFEPGSMLADPYDGLLDDKKGVPLPVHDCLGMSLYTEGRPWGIVTLDALAIGAFDDAALAELQRYSLLLEAAIRVTALEKENRSLKLLGSSVDDALQIVDESEILGASDAITQLLHELDVVADSDLPVLLTGETGVGKDLFARRLHRRSRRSQQPMVHVNCAALPESLAESELFGHVRGAFSGATSDRAGRFEAAQGGTLFLDEVGELPLSVQAKLLRALQNGEIQRLGTDQIIKTDVRIIAATNRQLKENTSAGNFRADLYHRLSVYPVHIPPLRERGRDALILAGHFLELSRARLGVRGLRLSYAAERALLHYSWPGNVRELEHVISRASLKTLSRGASRDQILTLEPDVLDVDTDPTSHETAQDDGAPNSNTNADLDDLLTLHHHPHTPRLTSSLDSGVATDTITSHIRPSTEHKIIPLRVTMENSQRHAIQQALAQASNNWAQAARLLELDSSNLHKLARKLGLK
ncbi:nitric oxide reductase transcriptional regulator NorR [Pollutimonas harenae]|uniref:Nitric oxide reductase transcriptional regulator NorR n=1 Tax=Pollutimonas harenae TaxID=657015 RepID=A0A853H1H7_9BURK|nr:nitric oxide reductase transcriptional regulator NorR [Pollutimonas harenae]NYT86816.1 nitric oxide reductase transcriptional regulator NorR [Pollutimonas harenae]TEA71462.1 nitric oxide reductase transcriptional regulator NorR [Pollutimonas harenae]